MKLLSLILVVVSMLSFAVLPRTAAAQDELPDNYKWLEDVYGRRPLEWVKSHNAASEKVLHADPRFTKLQAAALKVAESPDRLPSPTLRGAVVYNFWQDASHVRGILRRTTLQDYVDPKPGWKTILDYDALGKKEGKSWVNAGVVRLEQNDSLCLVGLSEGGEDARVYREFNLRTGKFVKNGFALPKAKSDVSWVDRNHLLVTTEWGPGTLTESGYPYITKLWKRGTPLKSAREVYRGVRKDVGIGTSVMHDGDRNQLNLIINWRSFFESEVNLWTPNGTVMIALPKKVDIHGLVENQMVFSINEDWRPLGSRQKFGQGSVLAVSLDDLRKDPRHLRPSVVFAPSAKEFSQGAAVTKSGLILATLDNVRGRAYVCRPSMKGEWTRKKLPVADNLAVSVVSANQTSDKFFLKLAGFITPESLWLGDTRSLALKKVKSRKPQFDALGMTVEQLWAISKDGTKVPYFVVRRKDIKFDGNNPTLLDAYGGFQASSTPYYSGTLGKLWLERGGIFVLANIRGGGEFGPAWHQAGLKTKRQRIFDDFAAVGQDLVDRKITSPRRLGIIGGSNGGLLVGVAMTQHPDMWNAVVIEIPLLDMLGFEKIAAGASWVGEYGSVSVPEERRFLASVSPYNQLKKDANYPEPLIFTTTKDDRVGPVHARKFAARMEEFGHPFYYYEIIEGGHGAGADLKQSAKTNATIYTYLTRKLMD